MKSNTTFFFIFFFSILLFHSIPLSHSTPTPKKPNPYTVSSNPPVLIPRLETWARAMQLSFHSISEPKMRTHSEYQSESSGMVSIPSREKPESDSDSDSYPFLDGNSDVLEKTMKSIAWLIKLASMHAQRLSNALVGPKDEAKILKSCKDSYDNASSNLQQAMKALLSKDVDRMKSMLHAVFSEIGDCRDEYSGKSTPFDTYDDKVTKMTNNCLTVLELVDERR
ncbi:hypothetical protein L2E82_27916 [Cichorium intybus]|uniref:Uncharacterized protein n=1 Tax=Cichorium intybus TaxID=13427 RepID=A0ACB9CUK8_CICIN|nr:hypothetical protein L2E82_27916 [Cichorium intybus]